MLLCSGNEKNKEIVYIYILAGLNLRRGVILRRRSKLMDAQKPTPDVINNYYHKQQKVSVCIWQVENLAFGN